VIQRFDLPSGTQAAPGQEFRYVWHCHVLEHEDNEMMRPYNVVR
jgi:spore coat protein A